MILCEQRSMVRQCRGFDEASTAKVRQTRGRNSSQWETVIVQDRNEYKSGETTTDAEVILIVVRTQPPSTGVLGMSHREQ